MNFNSLAFLLFLPLVVGIYWLLPQRPGQLWLLCASYFFYMYANPSLIFLLLASTLIDYLCSNGIERRRESKKYCRFLLLCSIFANLGLLFTFKYFDFFGENWNLLAQTLGLSYRVPKLGLILPVGISFYTFQTMSYTIDVYRGDFHAERDMVTFALYVTYFPQLVAGPIERPGNLLPQLKQKKKPCWEDIACGLRLLLCGFFRKCVVADYCGRFVNAVFSDVPNANGFAIAVAGSLFCFQMYCDFAGYSEIASGCARLMGVRLTRNFDRPYLSQSYGEFFRRWHISLNRWFTSYLYIPLGGNRRGTLIRIRNTVIVFALCGLWHGARWTYVLWGLYSAFWVSLEGVVLKPAEQFARCQGIELNHPVVKLVRRSYMFLIFIPAALLFRAESIGQFITLLNGILHNGFGLREGFAALGMSGPELIQLALVFAVMAKLYDWGKDRLPPVSSESAAAARWVGTVYLVLIIALCWIVLLATQEMTEFAYFQF